MKLVVFYFSFFRRLDKFNSVSQCNDFKPFLYTFSTLLVHFFHTFSTLFVKIFHTFSTLFDSQDGEFSIQAWTILMDEQNPLNDTVSYFVSHVPAPLPFQEDFESGFVANTEPSS